MEMRTEKVLSLLWLMFIWLTTSMAEDVQVELLQTNHDAPQLISFFLSFLPVRRERSGERMTFLDNFFHGLFLLATHTSSTQSM
jgi:hypothetical protein